MTAAVTASDTAAVETISEAVVLPGATRTDSGTVTKLDVLDNSTKSPVLGAAPLSVRVSIAVSPPVTSVGETLALARVVSAISQTMPPPPNP